MGKVWVFDTETKGTGAHVVPLEKMVSKPARAPKARPGGPRSRQASSGDASKPDEASEAAQSPSREDRGTKRTAPLPAGHVRKKATGEIGRIRSVDPKAGTACVLWLRGGKTSTVPLTAISRR